MKTTKERGFTFTVITKYSQETTNTKNITKKAANKGKEEDNWTSVIGKLLWDFEHSLVLQRTK